jgi:hypothetical protein
MWTLASNTLSDVVNILLTFGFIGVVVALGSRSWKLIQHGGCVGVLLGVLGYIPFLAAIGWSVYVAIQFYNATNIQCIPTLYVVCPLPPSSAPHDAWTAAFEIMIPGIILVGIGWAIQALGAKWAGTSLPTSS